MDSTEEQKTPSIVVSSLLPTEVENAELLEHASRGFTKDYTLVKPLHSFTQPFGVGGSRASPDLPRVLQLIQQDPIALAGIHKLVDRAMENGWYVRGIDKKSKESKAIEALKLLRFNSVLRKVLFHLIMYGNAFIEIVKDGKGEVVELHVVEPTLMRIEADNVGEVTLYWQDVLQNGKVGEQPQWSPDELVHIKNSFLTNSVWGDVDLLSLEHVLSTKIAMKKFVRWLFETNQFRGFFAFAQQASDPDITNFLAYYKAAQGDPTRPLALRGELEYQLLRDFKDETHYRSWLVKMDEETFVLLGIPPLMAGVDTGGGSRSVGDSNIISVNTKVKSVQSLLADMMSFDLLPKIGFDKVEFVFEPPDKKNIKDIIEIAEKMVNMNIKPEYIECFMNAQGFDLSDTADSIFYTPEELAQHALMGQPDVQNKTGSPDQYKSRQGKSDNTGNKRIGTGSAGTSRREQIIAHAEETAEERFARLRQFW
jgi:hypothetical protein